MVLKLKTNGFNCYNVSFCPQIPLRLGCVSSQNFGIAGMGSLFVIDITDTPFGPQLECKRALQWTTDALTDLCWSDTNPNILWTVSADGFIQVWDTNNTLNDRPIHAFKGHDREIHSINWSAKQFGQQFVTTVSSDSSAKVWDVLTTQPINTYLGHEDIVYCGQWSPLMSQTFATTSGDSCLKVWSLKQSQPMLTIKSSFGEVLSCDWNKFNQFLVTTCDTNGLINVWDIRSPINPLVTLSGHSKAIKCVKYSPFRESVIGSVSYDMTTRLWETNTSNGLVFTSQQHKEFVFGFDFNPNIVDQMADCSWDQFIHVFTYSPHFTQRNHL